MLYKQFVPSPKSLCILLLCFGALPALLSPIALAQDVDVPKGAVAFFTTNSCPSGWVKAEYATGRLVVAVATGDKVRCEEGNCTVGTPLNDREDRTHQHAYSTSLRLESKSISGLDSCCNSQGASSKADNPINGTTDPETSELPFTQLVICEKS